MVIVSQNTWSSESRAERFAFELCRVVTGEDVVKAQRHSEILIDDVICFLFENYVL